MSGSEKIVWWIGYLDVGDGLFLETERFALALQLLAVQPRGHVGRRFAVRRLRRRHALYTPNHAHPRKNQTVSSALESSTTERTPATKRKEKTTTSDLPAPFRPVRKIPFRRWTTSARCSSRTARSTADWAACPTRSSWPLEPKNKQVRSWSLCWPSLASVVCKFCVCLLSTYLTVNCRETEPRRRNWCASSFCRPCCSRSGLVSAIFCFKIWKMGQRRRWSEWVIWYMSISLGGILRVFTKELPTAISWWRYNLLPYS